MKPSRTLTTLAVGFLLLDAGLLVWGGVWLGSAIAIVVGAVFAAIAVALVFWWRRYRRLVEEVEQYRREMKAEAKSIRDLLKKAHHPNN